jgi:hypothetical protein
MREGVIDTGEETEDTAGRSGAAANSGGARSTPGTSSTRKKKKKTETYKQEMRPVIERLLGQMELMLLTGMGEVDDEAHEDEWSDVECPALVKLFVNQRGEFARWILDAASREEAVGIIKGMRWAWDKRKTKPDTEERSIQEAVKLVVDGVNAALMDKMHEAGWVEEARRFGKNVRTVCDMMDALDCVVDVEDYPRVMYESTRILESGEGDQPRTDTERDDNQHHQPHMEDQTTRGQELNEDRSKSRKRQPRREGRGNEAMEETIEPEGNGERRQRPESPRPRRRNLDAPGEGGWDIIDSLTVYQCARMLVGIQTVKLVPNSL